MCHVVNALATLLVIEPRVASITRSRDGKSDRDRRVLL